MAMGGIPQSPPGGALGACGRGHGERALHMASCADSGPQAGRAMGPEGAGRAICTPVWGAAVRRASGPNFSSTGMQRAGAFGTLQPLQTQQAISALLPTTYTV